MSGSVRAVVMRFPVRFGFALAVVALLALTACFDLAMAFSNRSSIDALRQQSAAAAAQTAADRAASAAFIAAVVAQLEASCHAAVDADVRAGARPPAHDPCAIPLPGR